MELLNNNGDKVTEVAVLFSDYQCLRQGLLKSLYDQERIVQDDFEQTSHITQQDMVRLAYNSSLSEVRALPDAYALLFLLQTTVTHLLRAQEITITHVGGVGMGAYAALYTARCYTFADGLYTVSKWAKLYEQFLQTHSFKKIEISGKLGKNKSLFISEQLTPDTCTVGGETQDIEAFQEKHSDKVIRDYPLESGLYADVMPDERAQFQQILLKVEYADAQIPCFDAHVPGVLQTAAEIKDFVANQPFQMQNYVQLVEQYADCTTILMPCADESLYEYVKQRYPEKNIIILS